MQNGKHIVAYMVCSLFVDGGGISVRLIERRRSKRTRRRETGSDDLIPSASTVNQKVAVCYKLLFVCCTLYVWVRARVRACGV